MPNLQYLKLLSLALLALLALPVAAVDYEIGEKYSDSLRSGGNGPEMVVIPAGRFTLGGGTPGQHDLGTVDIQYRLAFSTTEITVGQYRQFLAAVKSPEREKLPRGDDNLPASGISWDEAESYVTWLSRETGHLYRLPSASEWEYAARAGGSGLYHWGDDLGDGNANCLNCGSEYDGVLAPVGSFPPNKWGIYDMHGSVWEWAKDCIDSATAPPFNGMPKLFGNCEMRELRGGSARSDGWSIRSGARASAPRKAENSDVGFRVVMDVPEE